MKGSGTINVLESDWKKLFQWLMEWTNHIPDMKEIWHHHPLVVLTEIMSTDLDALIKDSTAINIRLLISDWYDRLKTYSAFSDNLPICNDLLNKLTLIHLVDDTYLCISKIREIKSTANVYLNKIDNCGTIDPGLSVLINLLKNYCTIIQPFNERWKEYPDFYFQQILKTTLHPAVPDKTRLLIRKSVGNGNLVIPRNTGFIAGEKEDATPFLYRNNKETTITDMQPGEFIFTHELHAPAGWIVESPMLFLQEGYRSVKLRMKLTPSSVLFLQKYPRTLDQQLFSVSISSNDGWTDINASFSVERNNETLTLHCSLSEAQQATSACKQETHTIDTSNPALRITLNPELNKEAYEVATQIVFTRLTIHVKVDGIKTFTVYNSYGEVNQQSPVYPFGMEPTPGNWIMFGNKDLVNKRLTRVGLDWTWLQLPAKEGGLAEVYKEYGENITNDSFKAVICWRKDKTWKEHTAPFPLFASDPQNEKLQAEQHLDIAIDDTLTEGFLRMDFKEPSMGFGHAAYRMLFSNIMLYNAKHKKAKPLPKEPVSPTLTNLTLSYEAEEEVFVMGSHFTRNMNRIYRILPLPVRNIFPVDPNTPVAFVQDIPGKMQLLLGIKNGENQKRIRIFFDITTTHTIQLPQFAGIRWFFCDDQQWNELPEEQITEDTTNHLTTSGETELVLPKKIEPEWYDDKGQCWLWASIPTVKEQCGKIRDILLNTLEVVAEEGNGTSLPTGTITGMIGQPSEIQEIRQLYPGIGGKEAELPAHHNKRISHRIAHRNRFILPKDYEQAVLDEFPEIVKVKCIPANENLSPVPIVRIVVVPAWKDDSVPLCPELLPEDIRVSIKPRTSPYVKLQVTNPDYTVLEVECCLQIKETAIDTEVETRLNRKINSYIAPWIEVKQVPPFNKCISLKGLYTIINNDKGVEETETLSVRYTEQPGKQPCIFTYDKENENEQNIYPPSPAAVFIPAAHHCFIMNTTTQGIGNLSIEKTFIIQ